MLNLSKLDMLGESAVLGIGTASDPRKGEARRMRLIGEGMSEDATAGYCPACRVPYAAH